MGGFQQVVFVEHQCPPPGHSFLLEFDHFCSVLKDKKNVQKKSLISFISFCVKVIE